MHDTLCHIIPLYVSIDFSNLLLIKLGRRGRGGVKYVFLGLQQQLCCQAEGKNIGVSKTAMHCG
jgi:hypothetical protein